MKCIKCGNNTFYARQIIKAHVIVDEKGEFYSNLPSGLEDAVCAARAPYGPYQCTRCGESYDSLEDTITTVCCGETKTWNSRSEAEQYFLEAIKTSKGAFRNNYVNVYTELQKGHGYCTDKDKTAVVS